jgi:hypothetical protein
MTSKSQKIVHWSRGNPTNFQPGSGPPPGGAGWMRPELWSDADPAHTWTCSFGRRRADTAPPCALASAMFLYVALARP